MTLPPSQYYRFKRRDGQWVVTVPLGSLRMVAGMGSTAAEAWRDFLMTRDPFVPHPRTFSPSHTSNA